MVKRQRAMKKVTHALFFISTELVKAIKLEGQKTVTVNWYTTKCLSEFLQEVNVRGLMLHLDNTSSNTAGLTAEFFKQKQIKVVEPPSYSPGLAMCDFLLFFNLKKNLRGRRFHSEEIDVAINAFFHQFHEMNGLRHLICGKVVCKSVLILKKTTLTILTFFKYNFKKLEASQKFQSDPSNLFT
ncbi:histone-lysine N-methyltransferase SETMAR [Trichonephila clavipes]|nr:histone-lysine N-methyltransferase SETMAR [Trichonephila clavipes]